MAGTPLPLPCPASARGTTPSGLPGTCPTGAPLFLYDGWTARWIAARRSQTARGAIDRRLSTGMARASAMRMAMPVPPCPVPWQSSTRPHRPADPASIRAPRRSWHAACGRPASSGSRRGAGALRSPCRPAAPLPTAPGSPARGGRYSPATAARLSAAEPWFPPRTRFGYSFLPGDTHISIPVAGHGPGQCNRLPPAGSTGLSRSGPCGSGGIDAARVETTGHHRTDLSADADGLGDVQVQPGRTTDLEALLDHDVAAHA